MDYEAEYNNRRRVPEHVEINARWHAASAAYRPAARAALDQSYGPGERHRYDLYFAADYEAEYNNRRRVPEHVEINARWHAASAAYRPAARAALDQPYGPGERHRYDLYFAADPKAPLVVYIHGGYWQRGGREDYAWLAQCARRARAGGRPAVLLSVPGRLGDGHRRGGAPVPGRAVEEDRQAARSSSATRPAGT